ncbi:MAG: DUF5689 domain-containing protein [Pseudobacter sp.]|uniref:DUF5689 domain-containing protein n=1 Tax=Pseudobacter sp. TaxID=2045420 RepID=UPI003F7FDA14
MKKLIQHSFLLGMAVMILGGCDKTGNFPGAEVSPYVAIFDLRNMYNGADLKLSPASMQGYSGISGTVVSDHRGNNMKPGLLMVQDRLRLNELRGIAINIGEDAAQYIPGDSVTINLSGGVMKRVDGLLQVEGVSPSAVKKVASGVTISVNRVPSTNILADPGKYESTEIVIVKGSFVPAAGSSDTYSGDKTVNDGFDNIPFRTEPAASFANEHVPGLANFFGVIDYTRDNNGNYKPRFRIRNSNDIRVLSSTITQTPIVISGFMADVEGTPDPNGEYIQFLATRDIDFSVTPYCVVTHNTNSGYQPTGVPVNGWAMGGSRSYKFDLTSGTVSKGEYFYVGNSVKLINGAGSTSIANAKWIVSRNTQTTPGDGLGNANADLLLNGVSLFTDGIAVFEGTSIDKNSTPSDVIITGYNGAILNIAQNAGLRIGNTDWYDIVNPVTLEPQPFYKQGSNTICLLRPSPTNVGWFYKLGGVYNASLGRWSKARSQGAVDLDKTSTLNDLEGEGTVVVTGGGTEVRKPTQVID